MEPAKERSNSSIRIRNELTQQANSRKIQVHDSVSIDKYMEHSNTLFREAKTLYSKGEWQYAYVQFRIFCNFTMSIMSHHRFKSQSNAVKDWCKEALKAALTMLETTAGRLDEIEDANQRQIEDSLIDELCGYDSESEESKVPQHTPGPSFVTPSDKPLCDATAPSHHDIIFPTSWLSDDNIKPPLDCMNDVDSSSLQNGSVDAVNAADIIVSPVNVTDITTPEIFILPYVNFILYLELKIIYF